MLAKLTSTAAIALATASSTVASAASSHLRTREDQDLAKESFADSSKNGISGMKPDSFPVDTNGDSSNGNMVLTQQNFGVIEEKLRNRVEILAEKHLNKLKRRIKESQTKSVDLDLGILGTTNKQRRRLLDACPYTREEVRFRLHGSICPGYNYFFLRDAKGTLLYEYERIRKTDVTITVEDICPGKSYTAILEYACFCIPNGSVDLDIYSGGISEFAARIASADTLLNCDDFADRITFQLPIPPQPPESKAPSAVPSIAPSTVPTTKLTKKNGRVGKCTK